MALTLKIFLDGYKMVVKEKKVINIIETDDSGKGCYSIPTYSMEYSYKNPETYIQHKN